MNRAEVTFRFLTPCLMAGAEPMQAEMRAPSIRGALRWWMRALGYDNAMVNKLFGSIAGQEGHRSLVVVRDTTSQPLHFRKQSTKELTGSPFDYFMWPLQKNSRGVIDVGETASFSVRLLRKCESEELEKTLKAFLLMGALGTRSRRCYGSIWPLRVTIDGKIWPVPNTVKSLQTELESIFDAKSDSAFYLLPKEKKWNDAISACAKFLKSFRCGSSEHGKASKYGKNDHDAPFKDKPEKVYRPVLGLPLEQHYHSGKKVVSSISGYERLASPVHFKIISLKNEYYPVVMFFFQMMPEEGTKVILSRNGCDAKTPELNWEIIDSMMYKFSKEEEILGEFFEKGDVE